MARILSYKDVSCFQKTYLSTYFSNRYFSGFFRIGFPLINVTKRGSWRFSNLFEIEIVTKHFFFSFSVGNSIKAVFSLFGYFIDMTINVNWSIKNVKPPILSVIFSAWNSLKAIIFNYKTKVYQTIINNYRENSSKKALQH